MTNSHYNAHNVRRSLIHFIFGKTGSVLLSILLLLVVVRVLPAPDYGIYIVMLAMLELVQLGSNLGVVSAAQRYIPEARANNQGLALSRLLMSLTTVRIVTLSVVCLVLYYYMPALAKFLDTESYVYILRLYLLVIVAEGTARYIDIVFDSLLLQGDAQVSLIIRGGLRLLGVFLLPLVLGSELSLQHWVEIEFTASLIAVVFALAQLTRYCNSVLRKFPADTNRWDISRILKYVGPNYLAQIVVLGYGPDVIKIIIQKVLGAVEVGAFGFSALLVGMLQRYLPIFLLLGMLRPLFVAVPRTDVEKHKDKINELANVVLKLSLFTLLPMISAMLLYRHEIIALLSGGKFPQAADFLYFFSIWLVLQAAHFVLGLIALAYEDAISILFGSLFALLGIVVGFLLMKVWGVSGMGWGLVLSEVIWCSTVAKVLVGKGAKIQLDWLNNGKMLLVAAFAAALVYLLPWGASSNVFILGLLSGVVCLVFLGVLFFLKPFSSEERALINKLLPKPWFVW